MPGIDESIEFKPIRIAVLTVSDSRTKETDDSGATLIKLLTKAGHENSAYEVVTDDVPVIRSTIEGWIKDNNIDAIITTGGTGLTGRDITPEAVKPLFDKEIDGVSTVFHMVSYETIGTSTLQSRAFAGISDQTYIFCIPGSPGACKDAWNGIFKYQLDNRHKPCNFVNIMPRLTEHKK